MVRMIVAAALLAGCAGGESGSVEEHGGDGQVFEYTAPDGDFDGYVTVDITNVRGGTAQVNAYVEGDDSRIASQWSPFADTDLNAFLAVVRGKTYMFEVENDDGGDFEYDIAFEFHEIPDRFEPNTTAEQAVPVEVGSTEGWFHVGYEDHIIDYSEYDDWYAFESAGPFSVELTDVPENIGAKITVYAADDLGSDLEREFGPIEGADVQVELDVAPGEYLIQVGVSMDNAAGHGSATLGDNLVHPYRIAVSSN